MTDSQLWIIGGPMFVSAIYLGLVIENASKNIVRALAENTEQATRAGNILNIMEGKVNGLFQIADRRWGSYPEWDE